MTINIMNQYIKLTKREINAYMKLIFLNKYNKNYCDLYIEKYINTRYYNFYEEDLGINIRRKIINKLKETQDDIIINNIDDRELIEQMRVFFYYVLYFDNVVYYKDLKEKVTKISKLRKRILQKYEEDFEEKLYLLVSEYDRKKQELIKKFHTKDFFLKISNYPNKLNVFRVNLKHNIKFPPEYSEFATNKAFCMGVINEDKLIIEYYLIVLQVLRDILKQNFKRQYIVEFSETILTKPKKIKSLLNIINNIGIQDKICLKIKYEDFKNKKQEIYDLMRDGYRFAVIIDNSFEVNNKNVEILQMFKFVILNKQIKKYDEFAPYKDSLQNVIEI